MHSHRMFATVLSMTRHLLAGASVLATALFAGPSFADHDARPVKVMIINMFGGAPFPYNGSFANGGGIFGVSQDFQWAHSYQTNVGIERQVGRSLSVSASYVGSFNRDLPFARDVNYPVLTATALALTATAAVSQATSTPTPGTAQSTIPVVNIGCLGDEQMWFVPRKPNIGVHVDISVTSQRHHDARFMKLASISSIFILSLTSVRNAIASSSVSPRCLRMALTAAFRK